MIYMGCILLIFYLTTATGHASHHTRKLRHKAHSSRHALSKLHFRRDLPGDLKAVRESEWNQELRRVVASGTCNDSPFKLWAAKFAREMGEESYDAIFDSYVDILPMLFKVYLDSNEDGEYFGTKGKETQEMLIAHDGAESFWAKADQSQTFNSDDVRLLGIHGRDLDNLRTMTQLMYILLEPGPPVMYSAAAIAYQDFIESLPYSYDNPLLTANALALPEQKLENGKVSPDMVLIGDGMIEYIRHLNFGEDGPEYIHAHEFAHHMQFEINEALGDDTLPAVESRRVELMADALGAYMLAHDDGTQMSAERLEDIHSAASAVGDCSVGEDGHHGTPKQRRCAVVVGAKLAQRDSIDGTIMHPGDFRTEFDQTWLSKILALDQSACEPLRLDLTQINVRPLRYKTMIRSDENAGDNSSSIGCAPNQGISSESASPQIQWSWVATLVVCVAVIALQSIIIIKFANEKRKALHEEENRLPKSVAEGHEI